MINVFKFGKQFESDPLASKTRPGISSSISSVLALLKLSRFVGEEWGGV